MSEIELLKMFISLGVPGVAFGVFYFLFRKFSWQFSKVPQRWVGPIVVLFMLLTSGVVFYALTLWAPNQNNVDSEIKEGIETIKIDIAKIHEEKTIKPTQLLRRAYILGFNYSLASRIVSSDSEDSEKKREFLRKLFTRCVTDSKFLGVEFSTPDYARKETASKDSLNEAINRAKIFAVRLRAEHSHKLSSSFELAFRVGMMPEYVPAFSSIKQKEIINNYYKLGDIIGIKRILIKKFLEEKILNASNEDEYIKVVFDFKRIVIGFFDNILVNDIWMKKQQLNVWEYGSNIALVALGYEAGLAKTDMSDMFLKIKIYSETLGLGVPELPERGNTRPETAAAIIYFLLHQVGEEYVGQIADYYGQKAKALFELSIKSHLILLLYAPGDPVTEAIESAIVRSATKAEIPEEYWKPLLRDVRRGIDYKDIKDGFRVFKKDVTEFLIGRVSDNVK